MTGSEKLAAMLLGAILMLSALGASAQQASNLAENTPQQASAAPTSLSRRTPAEMPTNPPKVTCDGGKLTISAQNSTLGAVLNAVHACTGAEIDIPEAAKGERLFAEFGPAPERAVLADFLSSMDYDFVIKASPSDPQKVQMVLLNPRSNDTPTTAVAEVASDSGLSSNRRAWLDARRNYEQSVAPPPDQSSQESETATSATVPVETAAAPPNSIAPENSIPVEAEPGSSTPATSAAAIPAMNEVAPSPGESSTAQTQGKSTQQMIGDMRRLFEQRKQMVQQQTTTTQ